jgi:calcium permeable stress-gated cation channel
VSGGRFAESTHGAEPSLSESIHSRVVGTRFKEVNRNSAAFGRLALGSHVGVEKSGELGPIPDPTRWGPNYPSEGTDDLGIRTSTRNTTADTRNMDDGEWDLVRETPVDFGDYYTGTSRPESGTVMSGTDDFYVRRRPPRTAETPSTERRETFPRRNNTNGSSTNAELPPHLRLQPQQPFVRPVSGLDHDDLGSVYTEISQWRSRLKVINAEIARSQREGYNDIADGARIKGWLLVGRGLRFIPGIQLIEGRAKEDIRWDVLQHERRPVDSIILWVLIAITTLLLAAGCEWNITSKSTFTL